MPMLVLTAITTALLVRSYHLREARFAALFIGLYVLMFFIEWMRMMLPIDYSFWIHHGLTGTLTVLTLGIIAHSAYLIIEPHRTITMRFTPWIFYIPVMAQPLYIWGIYELFGTQYIDINGWYYVQHPLYSYVLNPFMLVYLLMMFALMYHGAKTAPTLQRKNLCRWFMVNIVVLVVASLAFSEVFRQNPIVPDPIILVIFYTSLVYAVGMLLHEFSPSLAQRYHSVVNLSPVGILVLQSDGVVKEINRAAERILAITTNAQIIDAFRYDERHVIDEIYEQLKQTEYLEDVAFMYHHPTEQRTYELLVNIQKLIIDNRVHYTVTVRDVTTEREQQRINHKLAYFDSLTGLHNRAYFQKNVVEKFDQYPYAAIVLSDLNFFKHINDTHGHAIGDEVLQFTANLFRTHTEEYIDVVRLGGDEFLFFIADARILKMNELLDDLQQCFQENIFQKDDVVLQIVPSFGYAARKEGRQSYEELFRQADENMYIHKRTIKKLHAQMDKHLR